MRVDQFDFELPSERIALRPARPRDASRLLEVRGAAICDREMLDLPALLSPGDVLVFNDTKVIPAQLEGRRLRKEDGARSAPGGKHGSAPRSTSAKGRASGKPSSATPSAPGLATRSISGRKSPLRLSQKLPMVRLCCIFTGMNRSSCCSNGPGVCPCRRISRLGARRTPKTGTIIRRCSLRKKGRWRPRRLRCISRRA